jgi:hypothetical protein
MAIAGLYLLLEARRHGAPPALIARMLGNIGLDALVGSVPIAGSIFDVAFKAHRRNYRLLRRHLTESGALGRAREAGSAHRHGHA